MTVYLLYLIEPFDDKRLVDIYEDIETAKETILKYNGRLNGVGDKTKTLKPIKADVRYWYKKRKESDIFLRNIKDLNRGLICGLYYIEKRNSK